MKTVRDNVVRGAEASRKEDPGKNQHSREGESWKPGEQCSQAME